MHPRRSWSSSFFMSTPLLISLLLIFTSAFIFFALSSINKTWDFFNIFLVLFAMILCGVFARQNDDESCTQRQQHAFSTAVLAGYVSDQWFGFSFYESAEGNVYHTPPIRLQSPATDQVTVNHRTRQAGVEEEEEEEDNVKEIPVDNFETCSSTPPLPKSLASPHPTPPPPPPSSPQPAKVGSEDKHGKSERKKSKLKKEIAMVWASVLSTQKKRKKKQITSAIHNHDSHNALHTSSELPDNTKAPPPPSIFHSLFKRGLCKDNKVHAVSAPTPLPRKTRPKENTGDQLPLVTVAPPPPPPFKSPEMEVVVRGEDVDVDVRAATFIAKLKHEWKLEKIKSMREKANFRSCPGPLTLRGYDL